MLAIMSGCHICLSVIVLFIKLKLILIIFLIYFILISISVIDANSSLIIHLFIIVHFEIEHKLGPILTIYSNYLFNFSKFRFYYYSIFLNFTVNVQFILD